MVRTASTMLPLGTKAPDFRLPDVNGTIVSLADFVGKPLCVMFMCNHCPYVKHVAQELAKIARQYQSKGFAFVGISSNDVTSHPEDSPEMMKVEAQTQGYHFPYLYDETQEVAKAYSAACTPDFYVFDSHHHLVYRGQMDSTRPRSGATPTGEDLRAALDAVLAGRPISIEQRPSIGCNIKWKAGNEPRYFDPVGVP